MKKVFIGAVILSVMALGWFYREEQIAKKTFFVQSAETAVHQSNFNRLYHGQ